MLRPDNSKHNILKRIRAALGNNPASVQEPDLTQPVLKKYKENDESIVFAENFLKTKGSFFFCESWDDFAFQIRQVLDKKNLHKLTVPEKKASALLEKHKVTYNPADVKEAEAGVTFCESLIARTGSVLISSGNGGRSASVFPGVHIVIADTGQIVSEIEDGLVQLEKKYKSQPPSMISLISGPSRTADIEKTLVLGAHGPKELILFLIDDTSNPRSAGK